MSKDQYEMGKINCIELHHGTAVWTGWFWRLGGGYGCSL